MNEDIVKIGRVSSIDYKTGMIQVLYEDLSDEDDVSDYLPYDIQQGIRPSRNW